MRLFNQHFLRREQDHYQNYGIVKDGKNISWVAITGGSDGIGLAFCHHLAKQGFNILMIGRSESKMTEKLNELKKQYQKIDTYYILADFSKLSHYNDYERIAQRLKQYDVAMLLLNAGYGKPERFDAKENIEVEEAVNLNALHCIYMTKAMLPQIQNRDKKSALLYTSSSLGVLYSPGNIDYCFSKRLTSFLARGIHYELSQTNKVDVMTFEPFGVSSNLVKTKPNSLINSSEYASACALRDLGKEISTFGSISHYFQYWLLIAIGETRRNKMFYNFYTKQFKKEYGQESSSDLSKNNKN
ncbi:steroid dehydrogenase [Stylonychia lemnae]|uniref:Steroid dehydrogenase n=1 Tax=Stylonychia lemnae TaxID=5949 RepID=A0A078ADN3_STYLE|nr:steroid dehydrogenase [Stylonychia lemnae]|eukprot:CDW79642.1 steroid dehydrogenase [Stylonychia lemnae]